MNDETEPNKEPLWVQQARARIERQAAIVAALDEGTDEHRRANRALSILEKSLAAMIDADAIIAVLQKKRLDRDELDDDEIA